VVELVGPRSVPAAAAVHLLDPRWFGALGEPEIWCMAPTDTAWKPLPPETDGSYDSLALAWDLKSDRGKLTGVACQSLLARAGEYAEHVQRRAMPMPVPEEVENQVRTLDQLREALEIGLALVYSPDTFVSENDLWEQCERLGLTLDVSGAFVWRHSGNPLPLLSVTPIGHTESFSQAGVSRGDVHEGATIGFSVPLCPSISEALVGCFHVGRVLVDALGGELLDEEVEPVTPRTHERLAVEAQQAERLFEQAGIVPGSAESARIWR
jgi:hypothetical protein